MSRCGAPPPAMVSFLTSSTSRMAAGVAVVDWRALQAAAPAIAMAISVRYVEEARDTEVIRMYRPLFDVAEAAQLAQLLRRHVRCGFTVGLQLARHRHLMPAVERLGEARCDIGGILRHVVRLERIALRVEQLELGAPGRPDRVADQLPVAVVDRKRLPADVALVAGIRGIAGAPPPGFFGN